MMWLTEYNIDGVRTDGTVYVRRQEGPEGGDLADGWSLLQWFNEEVSSLPRWRVMIAEDLQNDEWLSRPAEEGGAGFHCQWDAGFCHPVREMLKSTEDSDRSVSRLSEVLQQSYNGDPFQSVIYTESHDEVANGSARMVTEIDPENPEAQHAVARALLGIGLVLTAPGVPMLFQGQVRMEDGWFEDDQPIDWSGEGRDRKALRICRRFISLRSGVDDEAPELQSRELDVIRADEESGLLIVSRGESDLLIFYNLHNGIHHVSLAGDFRLLARTGEGEGEDGTLVLGPYEVVIGRGSLAEQD
jgi:1,4-alpha-glucan branching enzyme